MSEAARIELGDIRFVGKDLRRPECVLATASGTLCVADWRGGVTLIRPDGRQRLIKAKGALPKGGIKPNGIALCADGTFLLAHLDDSDGGVWRLSPDGTLTPFLLEIEGEALPPTNFVHVDGQGRVWITVSTRLIPRTRARTADISDGFVILVDDRGARIVADGLIYTNEAKVDPSGRWLVVNETFGRRVSRYAIREGGALGARETLTGFGAGTYPDGLEFDVEGGIWIVSIYSNRLIRITESGDHALVLEDRDAAYVDLLDKDYEAGTLPHRKPDTVPGAVLDNISSIAFGGPDRRTGYLGCLQGSRIASFRSPIAGVEPCHWRFL